MGIFVRASTASFACTAVLLVCGVALAAEDPKTLPPNAVGAGAQWNASVIKNEPTSGIALDEKQTELVKKVSGYFNDFDNIKGAFVQTGGDNKRMKGKFYVRRPGRFRFDYALPSKQVIISDGQYLAIQDLDLNNEDRIALDQTPFRLLLRKDVDLLRDARINDVQQADDIIIVNLQDKDPDAPGQIKLFLATSPAIELKEWVTRDAQGLDTRVEVSDIVRGEEIDVSLFKIHPVGLVRTSP